MSSLAGGSSRAAAQFEVNAEGLTRSFGGVPAVRNVSFTVGPGEIHALCGHNGAGKSTVVKMLSGPACEKCSTVSEPAPGPRTPPPPLLQGPALMPEAVIVTASRSPAGQSKGGQK